MLKTGNANFPKYFKTKSSLRNETDGRGESFNEERGEGGETRWGGDPLHSLEMGRTGQGQQWPLEAPEA